MDRIKNAEATGDSFKIPSSFNLESFKKDKFLRMIDRPLKVVLKFDETLAGWALERWPDRAVAESDGAIIVDFRVDKLENFVFRILEYAGHAKVVEPYDMGQKTKITARMPLSD